MYLIFIIFDILMNIIFVDIYYIYMIHQVGWDRTGWEAFKYMLCDPQKGTILTRCDTNANIARIANAVQCHN